LTLLGAVLAIVMIAAVGWPGHMAAFASRLCLGSRHYPTRTRIEQIVVNDAAVLWKPEQGAKPVDSKAAQGRPLTFLVQCSRRLPASGAVYLTAADGPHARTRLELKPLSLAERLARLQTAIGKLNDAIQNHPGDISESWQDEIVTLIRFDAAEAVGPLMAAKQQSDLSAVVAMVTSASANWPSSRSSKALLSGGLARLNDDVSYKIAAGDAWSDPATVRMIPLPVVELEITADPPKYAADSAPKPDSSGRQIAVLEGSSVKLKATCTNCKPLASAWLMLQKHGATERIELAPRDVERVVWLAPAANSPFERIREELQYEIQVVDADGLSLQTPIRGAIRIRPDQPPTALAEVVHKVVLPTAEPVIAYRASDDHGISRLALLVDVERSGTKTAAESIASDTQTADSVEPAPAVAAPTESHRYDILASSQPIAGPRLPFAGSYPLALSPLKLAKGDRIKLTLEVTDYRGENDDGRLAGLAQRCEPLVLEISDESGVLAAISQPDQRSADQLSEIIKRQLGIGEEP